MQKVIHVKFPVRSVSNTIVTTVNVKRLLVQTIQSLLLSMTPKKNVQKIVVVIQVLVVLKRGLLKKYGLLIHRGGTVAIIERLSNVKHLKALGKMVMGLYH